MPDYITEYYYNLSTAREYKTCEEYIKKIRGFLMYINPDMKKIDINKISDVDIAKYLHKIETKTHKGKITPTSFSYRKMNHTILASFFKYLHFKGYIKVNPMSCIDRPQNKDEIKRELLTWDDLNNILKAVDNGAGNSRSVNRQNNWKERDKLIILFFISTGIRKTALSEINVEDFNDDEITVIDKRYKTHTYHMEEKILESLNKWLIQRANILDEKKCDALFISNRKQRMDEASIYNIVSKYANEGLGYHISPHKLRAAFCTLLYQETGDIEFVREAVGHSSVYTTQRYIVKDNTIKKKSASMIAKHIY
jgi:site-specific recombinase XerD